eukprot:3642229-Prymnesium_polylepis.1
MRPRGQNRNRKQPAVNPPWLAPHGTTQSGDRSARRRPAACALQPTSRRVAPSPALPASPAPCPTDDLHAPRRRLPPRSLRCVTCRR